MTTQPGSRPDRLTANERRFLEGLTVRHPWRHGGWWPVPDLIGYATQGGRFAGMSPQGLHQTAASLVRKGLAEKTRREGSRAPVEYRITDAGRVRLGTRAGPVACPRRNPHTPHGPCPGTAPEYPSETADTVTG